MSYQNHCVWERHSVNTLESWLMEAADKLPITSIPKLQNQVVISNPHINLDKRMIQMQNINAM